MATRHPDVHSSVAQLYRDHGGWLVGWLHRRLGDGHDAADLSQDVFTRLLARPRPLPLNQPRAYLSSIARGLVIDHWRRRDLHRAWVEALSHLPREYAPSAEARVALFETMALIDRALDTLKPAVRAAFLLVQLEGLTCAQAAQQLDISLSTVERHVAKALRHCYAVWFES
ncbi:sigma-70 family RNA polymerase sigma factor [Candidimonas nitroreducens]|uniref:RNA polymerase subunit sigma n=1 Tax=Candidimonas nitroreducens TaxID=683354 RepID=A0A225M9K5_9BURK|nr:sigma-70 family RNA polymerase sigma factor [Candidimonas nitroreducens]OWT55659.1 RNA polymerase subunit sigma [Candidimonas nitroreducens]